MSQSNQCLGSDVPLAMYLERGPGVLFMTTKIIASLRGEKMSRAKKGNDQKAILLKAPHALHSHFRQLAPGASSHLLAAPSNLHPAALNLHCLRSQYFAKGFGPVQQSSVPMDG